MESDCHASSFLEPLQALSQLDPFRWIHPGPPFLRHVLRQPTFTTQSAELIDNHRLCDLPDVGRSATPQFLVTISFQDADQRVLDQVVPCGGQQAKAPAPDRAFQHEPKCREVPGFPRLATLRTRRGGHTWAS